MNPTVIGLPYFFSASRIAWHFFSSVVIGFSVMTLHPAMLEQLGYVMGVNSAQAGTKAVPKDYAAFTRLSH